MQTFVSNGDKNRATMQQTQADLEDMQNFWRRATNYLKVVKLKLLNHLTTF